MVMSYASNYMANFLSPSQKERERQQREQQASRNTNNNTNNNNNDTATEAGLMDTELSQSSQARSNDSFTMLEYTRDGAPSTYSSTHPIRTECVRHADKSTS